MPNRQSIFGRQSNFSPRATVRRPTPKTGVAIAAAALLLASLAGCGAGASADPEQVLDGYVAALNSGDFAKALTYVQDAQGLTAGTIVNLGGTTIAQPIYDNGKPDRKATTATVYFQVTNVAGDQSSQPFTFAKVDGKWLLTQLAWLDTYSLDQKTENFEYEQYVAPLTAIGDVTIKTASGTVIPLEGGFVTVNPTSDVTFAVAGQHGFPDQSFAGRVSLAGASGTSSLYVDLSTFAIGDAVFAKADQLAQQLVYKWHYPDFTGGHGGFGGYYPGSYQFQYRPVPGLDAASSCIAAKSGGSFSYDGVVDGAFAFQCATKQIPWTTVDGQDVIQQTGPGGTVLAADSIGTSVNPGNTQFLQPGVVFQVKDGTLTLVWGQSDNASFDTFQRAFNDDYTDAGVPSGTVVSGLVPQASEDQGYVLSVSLG